MSSRLKKYLISTCTIGTFIGGCAGAEDFSNKKFKRKTDDALSSTMEGMIAGFFIGPFLPLMIPAYAITKYYN